MRIVVTGLCVTYPFGGVFWDYAQYLLGFARLGHDVLYVEDTATPCYDPGLEQFVEDGTANAAIFRRHLARLDPELGESWFYRDVSGRDHGLPWSEVAEFCRSAELFVQVTASTFFRDEYLSAERLVFIDTDPMYTPATRPGYAPESAMERRHMAWTREHDAFFTFGENVGAPECRIAHEDFAWQPTRQPVVLDCFESQRVSVAFRRRVWTTIASWEPGTFGPTIDGVRCGGKGREFERFAPLPRLASMPLELSLSGAVPREFLEQNGWRVREAWPVSRDPWVYRRYLARSFGEWSVAKNAYVVGSTGWFSCRSACYLALGVPVVVQDTGFRHRLPVGEGLLAFSTLDEAAQAIDAVRSDPERHSRAAIELAEAHFDSRVVLGELLEAAFRSTPRIEHERAS